MRLIVFKPSKTQVDEFNDFNKDNIVYKYNILNDGSIFVFFKPISEIGQDSISLIETLDQLMNKAQSEQLAAECDIDNASAEMADYKEKQAQYDPNEKEYARYEKHIEQSEIQIKMAKETIDIRKRQITGFHLKVQEILSANEK